MQQFIATWNWRTFAFGVIAPCDVGGWIVLIGPLQISQMTKDKYDD